MSDNDEQFDLAPQIDEPMNAFKVVHLYNKSDSYHLTRQVLLDSILTQNTYCFFYHILAKNIEEFNQMYGSFACLIDRNAIEADLYLNVDSKALDHIIKYIQTSKINGEIIYAQDWKTIDEIIDLSAMFGMPNLVTMLRSLHPSEETINSTINTIKYCMLGFLVLYKIHIDHDYDINQNINRFFDFFDQNKKSIVDTYLKTIIYRDNIYSKFILLAGDIFLESSIPDEIKLLINQCNINNMHHFEFNHHEELNSLISKFNLNKIQ